MVASSAALPTDASTALARLDEVQDLIRLVSPGEGNFGMGPNALLTSWKSRDLLIKCERLLGSTPQFLPDVRTGSVQYHFNGVPVYVGPLREDEEEGPNEPPLSANSPVFGGTVGEFTSIYALRLGGESGIRMLHYGGSSADKGVQVETLLEHTTNVARGYRLTGYYTLFVPERQAVARLWKVRLTTGS